MTNDLKQIDLGGVNCYLVKTEKGFILIDTGGCMILDKEWTLRREQLTDALNREGCTPENLKLLVLTHGDIDHVANAAFLRSKYGVKIAMHQADVQLVKNPDVNMLMKSYQYRSFVYRVVFKIMESKIRKASEKMLENFDRFSPDLLLQDGDSLAEYGFDAKILHLPGHTDGSVAVLTKNGELVSGDTFSNFKKPEIAPNAYDFTRLKQSIERLKSLNIKRVYPGHGKPFDMENL